MIRHRTLTRPAYFLALPLLLGASAAAQDLLLGSGNTLVHRAHAVVGDAQGVGACGGQVQAMAALGAEVFIGTPNGFVYRWDESTVFPTYAFDFAGDVRGMASLAGTLFLATTDGRLTQVDPSDGTVLSSVDLGVPFESLLADGDVLYLGTTFGVVLSYHPKTSEMQVFGPCQNDLIALASDGQTLFVADSASNVLRFDIASKAPLGSYATAVPAHALGLFAGDLLAGGDDGIVRRLDRHTGAQKGSFNSGSPIAAFALLDVPPPGTVYCAGTLCPCGNLDPENGCVNSTGFGSELIATGSASVGADNLVFYAYDVTPGGFSRYYMSQSQNALPFGDGQLCAGGGGYPAFRFGLAHTGSGLVTLGPGIAALAQQSFGQNGVIHPGSTWNFQVWYRDGAGPCGTGFNTSPGYAVTFEP